VVNLQWDLCPAYQSGIASIVSSSSARGGGCILTTPTNVAAVVTPTSTLIPVATTTPQEVAAPTTTSVAPQTAAASTTAAPSISSINSTESANTSPTSILTRAAYTGQSLLTGTCLVPAWTTFPLANDAFLEAPIIGCANDRQDCCPSLNLPTVTATVTPAIEIISALAATSLTICPGDYSAITSLCCPRLVYMNPLAT
jgi:hypothetical protein